MIWRLLEDLLFLASFAALAAMIAAWNAIPNTLVWWDE